MRKKKLKEKLGKASIIAAMVILIDQITKYFIVSYFTTHTEIREIALAPILDLTLIWNYGISFGVLNDAAQTQATLIILSLCIIVILIAWLIKTTDLAITLPLALIIGGAIGNIIDRINYGAVVDFIYFHYLHYYYPAFNVADSCIVIGALLLLKKSVANQNPLH